jgi:hypothetical protein
MISATRRPPDEVLCCSAASETRRGHRTAKSAFSVRSLPRGLERVRELLPLRFELFDSNAHFRELIGRVRAANPRAGILLVQMEAPTNLGPAYTRAFHALFGKVAAEEKVPLAPFLLDHVAGIARLNQGDGIHPTPEGARIAARNLWPSLRRVLEQR